MLNHPKDFWNMRAPTYDQTSGGAYARAYDLTLEHTVKYLSPFDRVLDFACGTGLVTLRLASCVFHIRGIDISPEMTAIAQNKVQAQGAANVEITNTDLYDPCLEPGSFDAVTAFNVMCYIPDPDPGTPQVRRDVPVRHRLSGLPTLPGGRSEVYQEPHRADALCGLPHPAGAGETNRPKRLYSAGTGESFP